MIARPDPTAPTVAALQSSAVALVRAMCAVGRTVEGGGNG